MRRKGRKGFRRLRTTLIVLLALDAVAVVARVSTSVAAASPAGGQVPTDAASGMEVVAQVSPLAQAAPGGQSPEEQPVPGVKPNVPPLQVPVPQAPPQAPPVQVEPGVEQKERAPTPVTGTVQVDTIRIMGNRVVSSEQLEVITRAYAHQMLSATQIEALRNELTTYYIRLGYLNSGALPPKYDAAARALEFTIVEGRLTQVQVHGAGRLKEYYVADRLQGDPDQPLNVNTLGERFQMLLNDPLISKANAKLLPGAQPGEAVLDVDVERARPYGLSLFGNNYRPPSVGQSQTGFSGWVRNLTGLGDLLDVTGLVHPGRADSKGGTADWHLPFNRGRAELYMEADRTAAAVIDEALLPLNINSVSVSYNAGLKDIIFQRGLRHQDTIGGEWLYRSSQTYLLGQEFSFTPGSLNGHVFENGFRLYNEYVYRGEHQVGVGRLTFVRTWNNLIQQVGVPEAVNPIPSVVNYGLFQGQYSRVVLDNGAQLSVRALLQQTGQHLPPLDQVTVGGLNTVRGFRENELVRDVGRVFNLQFDYPYGFFKNDFYGTIGPFVDFGQAKDIEQPASNIASAGLAWKASWHRLHLDFSYGYKLSKPSTLTNYHRGLQDQGIELQMTYDMFPRTGSK